MDIFIIGEKEIDISQVDKEFSIKISDDLSWISQELENTKIELLQTFNEWMHK